jgi:hypothetical protein
VVAPTFCLEKGKSAMPRPTANMPALALAVVSGALTSMASGFLIASYTISGITPAYVAPPRPERLTARVVPPSDDWREANYRHIGLWDEPMPQGVDTSL